MTIPIKPLVIVGIDNASKTGVVVYDPVTNKITRQVNIEVDKDKEISEQLAYLFKVTQKILEPYVDSHHVKVFTESPYLHIAPQLVGKQQIFIKTFGRLKGIEAVIQVACVSMGADVQSVPIRSHQAFTKKLLKVKVTGRDATKKAFQEGLSKLYDITFQNNDVSDAASIALYGASLVKDTLNGTKDHS